MEPELSVAAEPGAETAAWSEKPSFSGRRIVGAAFLINAIALGSVFSPYSLFLEPLEADFGATRAQTLLGLSILNLVMALCGPLVGRAIDRGPMRAVMTGGALCMATGFVLIAGASELWQVGLLLATILGVGVAMVGPVPASTLVANWFVRRRGTALGVAAMGATAAGIAMPPLAALMIASLGWRGTLWVFSGMCALLLVPVIAFMVIRRPEEIGQLPDGTTGAPAISRAPVVPLRWLLRQPNFWLVGAIFGLGFSGTTALLGNAVPFAASLGIETQRGAYVLSCVALFSLLGKAVFGALVDRIDKRRALWLSLGIQASAWLVFLSGPSFALLLGACAVWGLAMGGLMPMHGALTGATFGRATFGQIFGLMGFAMVPFTFVIPPLAGHVYDATGSYVAMLAPFLGVYALAAVLLVFVRIPESEPSFEISDAEEGNG